MSNLPLATLSQTPTPLPPAPRSVHLSGFPDYWALRVFLIPFVAAGIFAPCYALLLLLSTLFSTPVPATAYKVHTSTSRKSGTTYYVDYRYIVNGTEYHDDAAVPLNLYNRFDQLLNPLPAPKDEGPPVSGPLGPHTPLFNGQSLDGWTWIAGTPKDGTPPLKLEDVWSVKDGILHLNGKSQFLQFAPGYLRKDLPVSNFLLNVSERHLAQGIGGILIGITGPDKVWPRSLQIRTQFRDIGAIINAGDFKMTTPLDRTTQRKTDTLIKIIGPHSEKPLGQWNLVQIIVDHGTLTVKVNGAVQNIATDVQPLSPSIAIQSLGTEMEFRKIEFRPIEGGPAAPNLAPSPLAVSARFFKLGPWHHTTIVEGTSDWFGIAFLFFWAAIWNAGVSLMFWQAWVRPIRIRNLYKTGQVATGIITAKRIRGSKGANYYLSFIYEDPTSRTKTQAEARISSGSDWRRVNEGEAVTVLFNPKKPKQAVIYEYSGYRVEGAGANTPPLTPT